MSSEQPSLDTILQINFIPMKSALLNEHETTFYILAEFVTGSKPDDYTIEQRPPMVLSLVLDRSGSMNGRPLEEAIKCAKYIIENLQSTDFISIVSYDSSAKIESPILLCNDENKKKLIEIVSQIKSGGSTNLEEGWRFGMNTIEDAINRSLVPSNSLKRIFLLSDGQLNCGITDPKRINQKCSTYAAMGITTSTYGLGYHFNEQIMVEMSQSGEGNSYYGETVDDLMEPFIDELSLLQQLAVRRPKFSISSAGHKAITDITVLNDLKYVNDYNQEIDIRTWKTSGKSISEVWCRLQNIPFDAKRSALLKISVNLSPSHCTEKNGTRIPILSIRAKYEDVYGHERDIQSNPFLLPVMNADVYADLQKNKTVEEKRQELLSTALQKEINVHLRNGDEASARRVIEELKVLAQNNEHLKAVVAELQQLLEMRNYEILHKEIAFNQKYYSHSLESTMPRIDERMFMQKKIRKGSRRRDS